MNKIKPENYFSWDLYIIICLSYAFGFMGGWAKAWFLPLALIFLSYPFWLAHKKRGEIK